MFFLVQGFEGPWHLRKKKIHVEVKSLDSDFDKAKHGFECDVDQIPRKQCTICERNTTKLPYILLFPQNVA